MKRDWKPGDVAVRSYLGETLLSMRVSTCYLDGHQRGEHWHHEDGGWDRRDGRSTYRPLVVIDPEDREQVERLADLNERATPDGLVTPTASTDAMQAALREFANPKPPRPEEPTGLGAVVEDDKGDRWVRVGGDLDGIPRPWAEHGYIADLRDWVRYADIAAVAVLSEGVRDA